MKDNNNLKEINIAINKFESKKQGGEINLLVSGGAGFIGSCLIRRLLNDSKFKIFSIDKLGYASDLNRIFDHIEAFSRAKNLEVDLSNLEATNKAVMESDPDLVIHLAAESHVDRSIENPLNFIDSNIIGTYNLLQSVRCHWNKLSSERKKNFRFHHVSTDEVFGSLNDNNLFSEISPYKPRSPYAASKASSDHLVRAWLYTYGLPVVITNCSNNFGPWQFPEKLIPLSIIKGINKEPIPLYGDGNNIRDWIYVEDHIDALILCALNGQIGETYCIGASNEYKNIEIIEFICNELDKKISYKRPHSSLITKVQDRPGHDYRYAINPEKIKNELSWEPRYEFKEALSETVDWYLENLDWCKVISQNSNYKGDRIGINGV
tara:strand:- start:11776 stop:12909 length:1134 start_codon:yes stop_codon:yes gene_type:complete